MSSSIRTGLQSEPHAAQLQSESDCELQEMLSIEATHFFETGTPFRTNQAKPIAPA
jgi:hypothetical protein